MTSLDAILPFLEPLAGLLADASVTEVMVNEGGRRVWVERDGEVSAVAGCQLTPATLTQALVKIARSCGKEVSEQCPLLEARLSDGSRIAAVVPPCAVDGPTLTIRRFGRRYSMTELFEVGAMTRAQAAIMTAAVRARRNVLISGGTGAGKTVLLNALAASIPDHERLAILEENAELAVQKPNVIRFESRVAEAFESADQPRPAVTMRDLLRATLRHRPDRIIVGEVRGAEAYDLLQAWNTGHPGSLSTIHADSAQLGLVKLASLALQTSPNLSASSIERDVTTAVQVVVHLERCGRRRRVAEIYERPEPAISKECRRIDVV